MSTTKKFRECLDIAKVIDVTIELDNDRIHIVGDFYDHDDCRGVLGAIEDAVPSTDEYFYPLIDLFLDDCNNHSNWYIMDDLKTSLEDAFNEFYSKDWVER